MTPYYDDGRCVIYHGDCREVLEWLEADVLVTDPPYGIDLSSGKGGAAHGTCKVLGDTDLEVRDEAIKRWGAKPAIVFGTWRKPRPGEPRAILIWDKGGHVGMGDLSFPWKPCWEEIYVYGDGFSGVRTSGVLKYWSHPTFNAGRTHPTEKPLELMRELVDKCPPGVVADPFMGSGSTLRAAKDCGRRAIGIELEERYCEVAAKRLAQEVLWAS